MGVVVNAVTKSGTNTPSGTFSATSATRLESGGSGAQRVVPFRTSSIGGVRRTDQEGSDPHLRN